MGQKDLGVLYESLLGLGITTVLVDLKWDSQYSNIKQASAMFLIFSKQRLFDNRDLRYLQEMWSGPGDDKEEHLAIASLNSCLEKVGHSIVFAWRISLRKQTFTSLFSAEL